MKSIVLLILAFTVVAAENKVKYFLTFSTDGSGDVDADACICSEDFTPNFYESYPSRQKALDTIQQACNCVDCFIDRTFQFCNSFMNDVFHSEEVHIQTYGHNSTEGPELRLRRKRGALKRFFDRFGGGLSLKHNQESRADVNLGINEDIRPGSGNTDTTVATKEPPK